MNLFVASLVLATIPALGLAQEAPPKESSYDASVGLRVDCLNSFNLDKGSSQACFQLTGLRLKVSDRLTPDVSALVVLDPFGTPLHHLRQTPFRDDVPINADSKFVVLDHYELRWEPRPNLEFTLEEYSGSAYLPSASGLALAGQLSTLGWDQMVLSVNYNLQLLEGVRIKFAGGNGEGERFSNTDPQQFFGFEVTTRVVEGIGVHLGLSEDGNSAGSEQYDWLINRYQSDCGIDITAQADKQGFSSQRVAAAIFMDGKFPSARGLKMAVGWQRNVDSDLDKQSNLYPTQSQLDDCVSLDPSLVFVEDPDNEDVNAVQRVTLSLSASYRILDKFFFGLDFERRRIDSGNVRLFQQCDGYQGVACPVTLRGERSNKLIDSAYTLGGGVDLDRGLTLSIEYHTRNYDKKYTKFYFPGRKGKASDSLELFNARIAYHWK